MLNKVLIIGNLGKDPEVRYTSGGTQVCNFSVATTERWRDQGGQLQESTEWHRITAWGKLAEICGQYLRKGSKVYIEGKLQTRKWQDQSGQDRYTTEIVVREMKMLDSKPQEQRGYGEPQPQPEQRRAPEQQAWVKPDPNQHNPPGYNEVPF